MSDPLDLDALQALCDAATPGPWMFEKELATVDSYGVETVDQDPISGQAIFYARGGCASQENAAFVAAAREAVPQLIAEVRRLRFGPGLMSELADRGMANLSAELTTLGADNEALHEERAHARDAALLAVAEVDALKTKIEQQQVTWREMWDDRAAVIRERDALRAQVAKLEAEGADDVADDLRRRCKSALGLRHADSCPVGKHCEDPHCSTNGACTCGLGHIARLADLASLALKFHGQWRALRDRLSDIEAKELGSRRRAEKAEATNAVLKQEIQLHVLGKDGE
jgi:hypothetical protein